VPSYFNSTKSILDLCQANENDAWLCMSLMHKLVILPLTKQLTGLAGNLWARSLRSSRAERVEFLLLHEFHRLKYIIPEKYTNKEREDKVKQEQVPY
jgi:DNA polymerase alpha subunit A